MDRAAACGLVFNSEKCFIKQRSISFFGNTYTDAGIMPDPAKVRDIENMPVPENKEDLQRFLGMMTYLSQFIPKFSEKAYALRILTKDDVPWTWDTDQQKSFDELKQAIPKHAYLKYYDPTRPARLEVDASQKGLGAALIQSEKPVAFGSKTLTECQSRYSNIEREMLAVVHGIQRYHTYLYGRPFTVRTDHKPLVTICTKPLHAAPPRLQRMLLKIQGYNCQIEYRPGKEMILSDTLSRLPNPENNDEIDLDVRVDGIDLEAEDHEHQTIALINFSMHKQRKLQEETTKDPTLNAIKEIVYQGWPTNIKDLPVDMRPYWSYRDELAMEAGVLFKGRQIVIPESMREDILTQLHIGHQGIEKTRRLVRESVYWPNISKDIEQICKPCEACQKYQDGNKREPLIPHAVPARPWQFSASDLFEIGTQHYLMVADRYTKYPFVDAMPSPVSSQAVANRLRSYCALFGRPDEIMTDNGPQYAGQQFRKFVESWGITHVTSSPNYPQSNGFIERHIRHVKPIIKKVQETGEVLQMALLNLRATPVDTKLPSPGEMMFGRPLVTFVPSHGEPGPMDERERLEERNEEMKLQHDPSNRTDLQPLYVGQRVRILDKVNKTWCPGTVVGKHDSPRSYTVETPNGTILRRNRSQLRDLTAERRVRFADEEPPADAMPNINVPPSQPNNGGTCQEENSGGTNM